MKYSIRIILALAFLLLVAGIVGRMDYEDKKSYQAQEDFFMK